MQMQQSDSFSEMYGKRRSKDVFIEVVSTLHEKGEFGDMPLDVVLEHQLNWFINFQKLILENNIVELRESMIDRANVVTRGWFSKLTGLNVKHMRKDEIDNVLKEFVVFRVNGHDINNFGKYLRLRGIK